MIELGVKLLGPGDGTFHAFGCGVSTSFAPSSASRGAALQAHALGHGEDERITFRGGDEGERDAVLPEVGSMMVVPG